MAVCSLKYFFVNEYLGIFISCLILLIAVVKTIGILNSSRKVSAQGKSVFITGEFNRLSTSRNMNSTLSLISSTHFCAWSRVPVLYSSHFQPFILQYFIFKKILYRSLSLVYLLIVISLCQAISDGHFRRKLRFTALDKAAPTNYDFAAGLNMTKIVFTDTRQRQCEKIT